VTGAALAVSLVPVCITIVQRLATCFLGLQMDRLPRKNRVIILIAPDFDEEAVVHCLCQMRQRGTAVTLVGTPSNLVNRA
jgi:hypothetical protein